MIITCSSNLGSKDNKEKKAKFNATNGEQIERLILVKDTFITTQGRKVMFVHVQWPWNIWDVLKQLDHPVSDVETMDLDRK